ncbi:hypothetical protein [Pseudomonas sp. S2_H01]
MPMVYGAGDDLWQLTLTKVLSDTGWVLYNPYLGAPEIASWHHNAAAQTSALHSLIMLGLNIFIHNPIALQQYYFLLNFPLIAITCYTACRLLSISRISGVCVALLYAFTTFRFDFSLYSFLPNYFTVPLAIVSVIWIAQGKFESNIIHEDAKPLIIKKLISNKLFLSGCLFIILISISDGYYAFFTLLLLGFSVFYRILSGSWRKPVNLVPGAIYVLLLLFCASAIQLPLYLYKKSHQEEFLLNGKDDPALVKHPFEAEVYSTNLKLLVTPTANHRIDLIGAISQKIDQTSLEARYFKVLPVVPLGALCSLFLFIALSKLVVNYKRSASDEAASITSLSDVLPPLILFTLLCCITGGIGSIIALIFPTIRAYDRFALFLIFLLLLLAARLSLPFVSHKKSPIRYLSIVIIGLITVASLYDQIPVTSNRLNLTNATRFRAEQNFVRQLESKVPAGAMVYQYPYAQYLRPSSYYGWGAFAQIRLYLNSHGLHWSNGGAKNSPADDWNYRLSSQPFVNLLTEVEALGFSSMVIDRTVVKPNEYDEISAILTSKGYFIVNDVASNLAYVILRDPGYRIKYTKNYRDLESITITSSSAASSQTFPELVNSPSFKLLLRNYTGPYPTTFTKLDQPAIFLDGSVFTRGTGESAITPLADMKGSLNCSVAGDLSKANSESTLFFTLTNNSSFDWTLDAGTFPIRVGYHLVNSSGDTMQWDNGFRAPVSGKVKRGDSIHFNVPYSSLKVPPATNETERRLVFSLVQDASAWFSNISCAVGN